MREWSIIRLGPRNRAKGQVAAPVQQCRPIPSIRRRVKDHNKYSKQLLTMELPLRDQASAILAGRQVFCI